MFSVLQNLEKGLFFLFKHIRRSWRRKEYKIVPANSGAASALKILINFFAYFAYSDSQKRWYNFMLPCQKLKF
jgi:hypothetical protein